MQHAPHAVCNDRGASRSATAEVALADRSIMMNSGVIGSRSLELVGFSSNRSNRPLPQNRISKVRLTLTAQFDLCITVLLVGAVFSREGHSLHWPQTLSSPSKKWRGWECGSVLMCVQVQRKFIQTFPANRISCH